MGRRLHDLTLDNLSEVPAVALEAVYWELSGEIEVEPRFQKEEWLSSTLLEWGPCGKLATEDGAVAGMAQYGPPALFPRIEAFPSGPCSEDAIYLAYCFVVPDARGAGVGSDLVRAVARDLIERGYRAVEALGERDPSGGWVLPMGFLEANRFRILREDPVTPMLRLDLRRSAPPREEEAAAAIPLRPCG